MAKALPWWQRGAIYQLLVPSFFDTDDDGMGDLSGVTQKLEYLQWLGVEAVWLSPIYASPLEDLGYDVSDFTDIDPRFGTLADFEDLMQEAHGRGLKVILDWIPNHTSSEHPWFQGARSSREHPLRDWYIWRDPKPDGSPPNNWLSIFGGSVWEFDEATGQYYLHTFLKEQPDLNWSHPDVQEAVLDAMRFWLDRGIDGFRLDALDLLTKDPRFPDNPPNPNYNPEFDGPDMAVLPTYTRDQPAVHDVVATMRRLVDEYQDRVLLGELYLPTDQIIAFYGADEPELHLPLQPVFGSVPWTAEELYRLIDPYLGQMPEDAWPSWMLSTHDGRRVASRAGAAQAPVAAMMLLTLPGTPIIYYGDEIGMHDVKVPPEKERDPQGKRIGRKRDPVRTPMQWNDWVQAGFTSGEPWLPVADDYEATNVDDQSEARSLLTLYRRLLSLRREIPTLVSGSFVLEAPRERVISYRREDDERRLLILLNLSSEPQTVELDEQGGRNRVLLSTFHDRENEEVENAVQVRGDEGLILTT
jgi:alpha-glucosidase